MTIDRIRRQWSTYFQAVSFLVVGGLQVLLDWLVFFVLSATGVPVALANLSGRATGAGLGFWLNGSVTFRRDHGSFWNRKAATRFVLLWLVMTVASTLLVSQAVRSTGLTLAWLIKPVIELVLAAISFFISRHWVYR